MEKVEKGGKIVKTGMYGADVIIGISHALEDYICESLDVIASVSSLIGLIVGNIPATKQFTFITGSVTIGCKSIRY